MAKPINQNRVLKHGAIADDVRIRRLPDEPLKGITWVINLLSCLPLIEADPVSTLLDGVYLPNWTATELRLSPEWGLSVPANRGCLYVILRGGGWFKPGIEGVSPIQLQVGDHLVTTRGMPHEILSDLSAVSVPVDSLMGEPLQLPKLDDGTFSLAPIDSNSTVLLYGQFDLSELKQNPLDVGLPDIVHLNHRQDFSLASCLPMLTMIQTSRRERPAGWKVVIRRLSELILLQTVSVELSRRVREPSDSESGAHRMMRAVTDKVIGPVLRVLVETPEAPWTVPQMARMAKVSKSAFSDRFRKLVGLPPLQYLTEIRMGKSRRLLRDSNVDISEIAILVGYESPSSFSNVFKRWHGKSPLEYRRGSTRELQDRSEHRRVES